MIDPTERADGLRLSMYHTVAVRAIQTAQAQGATWPDTLAMTTTRDALAYQARALHSMVWALDAEILGALRDMTALAAIRAKAGDPMIEKARAIIAKASQTP